MSMGVGEETKRREDAVLRQLVLLHFAESQPRLEQLAVSELRGGESQETSAMGFGGWERERERKAGVVSLKMARKMQEGRICRRRREDVGCLDRYSFVCSVKREMQTVGSQGGAEGEAPKGVGS